MLYKLKSIAKFTVEIRKQYDRLMRTVKSTFNKD